MKIDTPVILQFAAFAHILTCVLLLLRLNVLEPITIIIIVIAIAIAIIIIVIIINNIIIVFSYL